MLRSNTKYKKKLKKTLRSKKSYSVAQNLLFIGKLFIFSIFAAFIIWLYLNLEGILSKWSNHISDQYYQITKQLGFALEEVSVDGQKYTNNEEIGKKLKFKKHMPIFAISLEHSKSELEKLPWVKNAVVERDLPNSIHVYIEERIPLALGQKDRKLYIIDEEGSIINEKDLASHSSLPIMIGEGAEIYARDLIKMLKKDKELFAKIHAIIRVSERRWNIRFDNDLEVKLPEENMEKAWQKVIKIYQNKQLFLPDISAIDLRVANKIYIEKK